MFPSQPRDISEACPEHIRKIPERKLSLYMKRANKKDFGTRWNGMDYFADLWKENLGLKRGNKQM